MSTDDTVTRVLDTPVVLGTASGTAEVQKIDYTGVTAGKTTTLTLDGETTSNIKAKAEATAAEIKSKLEALSNVGPVGSDDEYHVASVTGSTGGPFEVTFGSDDGNVPTLTAAAAEGSAPAITTVTDGVAPSETPAVQRGTGNADATTRTSPLAGSSPKADRAANHAKYGDA